MAKKYQNKYRSDSIRLQTWDYGSNGSYFITICTKDRVHFFGKIEEGTMILSEIGKLADRYWAEIPDHFPFIELKNFVIMPDHMHGVLIINKNQETRQYLVSTENGDSTNNLQKSYGQARYQNQGKNTISSIIGSYKSITTRNSRKINPDFAWQPLFYDHIIRDSRAFHNIQKYILDNPKNWKKKSKK